MSEVAERNIEGSIDALREALANNDVVKLREIISAISPYELVEIIERLDINERRSVVPYIQVSDLKVVINKLPDDVILELIRIKGIEEVAKVLIDLPSDEVADLLPRIPPKIRSKLMASLPHWKSAEVTLLLKYPQESVGGLMTPQIPIFHYRSRVGDVLKEYVVKNELGLYDKHYYIYAVDDEGKLVGWIDVKSFITQSRDKLLKDVISKPPVAVYVHSDREEAAKAAIKYDLLEIPVIDGAGKLVGAATIDDIVDVLVSEYTEDLMRFGGFIEALRGRYLTTSPITIVRRRFLPLMILYLINSITGGIVASFTEVIERIAVLASFLPMLADNSGNVGSQASTFIIRSLTIGEVGLHDVIKIIKKEVTVVILLAFLIAPISFVIASSITYLAYADLSRSFTIGLVVAISLITSTLVADLVGVLLPLFLLYIKVDPAAASAPLITTIADIMTAITYFTLASILLAL